ncbi:MAG: metallophosphoesterase [Deltaproteobacteria bacterium]|nr:metallophosphoesterase [Deltaproteobacteria bacterium]
MLPFLKNRFKKTKDTLILSDLHITTAEPDHPDRPLWKKFNSKEYFIDDDFAALLKKAQGSLKKGIELVLAGDIFDFDSVISCPENPAFTVSPLEKKRGLNSEEAKSLYKIKQIIKEHPVFFAALKKFVEADNRVVFIIGNHDLEVHWPSVKQCIIEAICPSDDARDNIRFCNWFYISNADTLIEHGNQYDPYCSISNPIKPFFKHQDRVFVKLPFGNHTHRYLINSMGIFNPHVDTTYLLNFWGYLKFYISTIRVQPLLLFSWLFGAFVTWFMSIKDRFAPRIKNPLMLEDLYNTTAFNANAEPKTVRALRELHARPITWDIFKIMRVLWLDKALILLLLAYASIQVAGLLNILWDISLLWAFLIMVLFMPLFLVYTWKIQALVPAAKSMITTRILKDAAAVTGTQRLVCGHSHSPESRMVDTIAFINAGYWSPTVKDIKCTSKEKNKSFVWLRPDSKKRTAKLIFWDDVKHRDDVFV